MFHFKLLGKGAIYNMKYMFLLRTVQFLSPATQFITHCERKLWLSRLLSNELGWGRIRVVGDSFLSQLLRRSVFLFENPYFHKHNAFPYLCF